MNSLKLTCDAVIVGGGFYATAIAIYLAKHRSFKRIILIEKESDILRRASYNNQARVHNGYHYPRSFTTAYRSRVNLPKFVQDWSSAVYKENLMLYAIARNNSKVTAKQFERFCKEIGANVKPASTTLLDLFDERLIEGVFQVEEFVFDSTKLADWAKKELAKSNIEVRLNTVVTEILNGLSVRVKNLAGEDEQIRCNYIFNCSYSGLNQIRGNFPGTVTKLKHEIAEMALLKVPSIFESMGVTVMDGPFFSLMPFPAKGKLHTLSHVRYTPHLSWMDNSLIDPYKKLENYNCDTRFDRMIRDASRYLPLIKESKYIESLFEVKTVLVKNENDDGRPILFEKHTNLPGCYSILGGKIDNIYDVFEKLEEENFDVGKI